MRKDGSHTNRQPKFGCKRKSPLASHRFFCLTRVEIDLRNIFLRRLINSLANLKIETTTEVHDLKRNGINAPAKKYGLELDCWLHWE